MKNSDFKQLRVWQMSMELVKLIYNVSSNFPSSEKFGLIDQMRRSAVSIPSNISEGHGRISQKDFVRFLLIANGSCSELTTQLLIAQMLGFVGDEEFEVCESKILSVRKMLSKLIAAIENNQ